MAIREYSFKGWDLCGLLTLQSVTSNSAYRNRVCGHITSLELAVRKIFPMYTKKNICMYCRWWFCFEIIPVAASNFYQCATFVFQVIYSICCCSELILLYCKYYLRRSIV